MANFYNHKQAITGWRNYDPDNDRKPDPVCRCGQPATRQGKLGKEIVGWCKKCGPQKGTQP